MALGDQILSRLRRTRQAIFGIGNIQVKDSSGVVHLRNADDSAFADGAVNKIRVQGTNASDAIILNAPSGLGASLTLVLPATDGSSNQFLRTDGSGNLSFADGSAGSMGVETENYSEVTSSPLTIYNAAANSEVTQVIVRVSSAASGGTPTLQIGVTGDADLLMTVADIDLKTTGDYVVYPYQDVGGSNIDVIATITPDGQTFSGSIFVQKAAAT